MTARGWWLVVAVSGIAIFGLSFVNGWIEHDRELLGEGYRHVRTGLGAWRTRGMPILTAAALLALVVGLGALVSARRPRMVPAGAMLIGSMVVLGLVAAHAMPLEQDGHASSVRLGIGPLLPIGALLAAAMVAGSAAAARPSRRSIGILVAGGVAVVLLGTGARWVGLQWAEGTGEHWADGSYRRPALADQPATTLTIEDGQYRLGDRWAGTWESSGWTVVLDDDPACAGSRGTYHAHGEGEADLRFVKVVDTCEDGARAATLESGIWERQP